MKQCTLNTETAVQFFDNQPHTIRRAVFPQPKLTEDGMWLWNGCRWEDGMTKITSADVMQHCPDKPGEISWVEELPGMTEKSARLFIETKDAVMAFSGEYWCWHITYCRIGRNEALAACAEQKTGRTM